MHISKAEESPVLSSCFPLKIHVHSLRKDVIYPTNNLLARRTCRVRTMSMLCFSVAAELVWVHFGNLHLVTCAIHWSLFVFN